MCVYTSVSVFRYYAQTFDAGETVVPDASKADTKLMVPEGLAHTVEQVGHVHACTHKHTNTHTVISDQASAFQVH